MRSKLSFSSASMCVNSPLTRCLREVEDDLLGAVDEITRLAGRSQPRRAISPPARIRPRSVAVSRTIAA
jgi:hypothetical protein